MNYDRAQWSHLLHWGYPDEFWMALVDGAIVLSDSLGRVPPRRLFLGEAKDLRELSVPETPSLARCRFVKIVDSGPGLPLDPSGLALVRGETA